MSESVDDQIRKLVYSESPKEKTVKKINSIMKKVDKLKTPFEKGKYIIDFIDKTNLDWGTHDELWHQLMEKVVSFLLEALSLGDKKTKKECLEILGKRVAIEFREPAFPQLLSLLKSEDNEIRNSAISVLSSCANQFDMNCAIMPLAELLGKEKNEKNIAKLAEAFQNIASGKKQTDISIAIKLLENRFSDKNRDVREYAVGAVTYHRINKEEWKGMRDEYKRWNNYT